MRTVDDLVRLEVVYCVSGLVHDLANSGEYAGLAGQAVDLCTPLLDYESAARDDGWSHFVGEDLFRKDEDADTDTMQDNWEDLCDAHGIEPHEREIYEHWIVTDWLAEKLEAKGERVDHDFAGLTIWGRTTTGQAVAMDSVIAEIHADAVREYRELVSDPS